MPNGSMYFSWSYFCYFDQALWTFLLWPWESSLEALWWKSSNSVCLVQPRCPFPPLFLLLFSCWASTSCTVEMHRWQGSRYPIRGKYNPSVCLHSLLLPNTLKVECLWFVVRQAFMKISYKWFIKRCPLKNNDLHVESIKKNNLMNIYTE